MSLRLCSWTFCEKRKYSIHQASVSNSGFFNPPTLEASTDDTISGRGNRKVNAMSYKDRKARDAAYQKWYERNRDKRAAYKKTLLDSRRERNWRFRLWETAHMTPEVKEMCERMHFLNSIEDLERPVFIFELHGKKQKEFLDEPLPEW